MRHFHGLRVEVNAINRLPQNPALAPHGQVQRVGFGVQPAPVLFSFAGIVCEPLLPVFTHALEHAEQKAARTARRIKKAELERFLRLFPVQHFADGLLDNIFDDVTRRVINAARLANFRLFLDDRAASVRPDDLAEKPLVNRAENFYRDVAEFVAGILVANLFKKIFKPVIAHDQFLGEMQFEEIAVEKRNVRGRTPIQRTNVAHDGIPQRTARRRQSRTAPMRGRCVVECIFILLFLTLPSLLPRFEQ